MISADRRDVQYKRLDDRPTDADKAPTPLPAKKAKVKATKPHEQGVVYLPLPTGLPFIMANSDQRYTDSLGAFLAPIDKLGTIIRWFGVVHNILYNSTSPGLLINFMSSNSPEGIATRSLFFVVCGVASLCNLALERHAQNTANEETKQVFQNIYRFLEENNKVQAEAKGSIHQQLKDMILENIRIFNQYLEKIRLEDETLREKYQSLMIDPEDFMNLSEADLLEGDLPIIQMKFKFKDHSPKKKQIKKILSGVESKELPEQEASFWEKTKYYVWQKFCVEIAWNKILGPLWSSGAIASFVFWGAWILAGVATGVHAEEIFGLDTYLALAVTGACALPYLGIRVYNYFKHGSGSWKEFDENARLTHEAEMDVEKILAKTQKRMEFDRDLAYIKEQEQRLINEMAVKGIKVSAANEAHARRKVRGLDAWYESPYLKAAIGLATTTIGSYGLAHYEAWWVKVGIQAITMAGLALSSWNPIAGGVLMLIGAAFGVGNMVKRYNESSKLKGQLQENPPSTTETLNKLEEIYTKRVTYLAQLKSELRDYKNNNKNTDYRLELPPSLELKNPAPQTRWQKVKTGMINAGNKIRNNPWVDAWDWSMTGVFFSRLLFTTAAVFLPFAALTAVASNPITLGIVIGIGAAYILMKLYEKRQIKKEARIKEIPEKLEEVEKQIELAERTKNSYQMSEQLTIDNDNEREMIAKSCGAQFKPHLVSRSASPSDKKISRRESKSVSVDLFESSANEWGPEPTSAFLNEQKQTAATKVQPVNQNQYFFKPSSRVESQVPRPTKKETPATPLRKVARSEDWGPDPEMLTGEGSYYGRDEDLIFPRTVSVR